MAERRNGGINVEALARVGAEMEALDLWRRQRALAAAIGGALGAELIRWVMR